MHAASEISESSQQDIPSAPGIDGRSLEVAEQSQDSQDGGATVHNGSREASGQQRRADGLQHQQSEHSAQSVSSEDILSMGAQWLLSAYRARAADCPKPPAVPEGLYFVGSLLPGMQEEQTCTY